MPALGRPHRLSVKPDAHLELSESRSHTSVFLWLTLYGRVRVFCCGGEANIAQMNLQNDAPRVVPG